MMTTQDNLHLKRPSDCSILVVDDDEIICDWLSAILKESYKVTACRSGSEAIQTIADRDFDVVISDLNLPGASGLEVIKYAKEKDDFTEVMIITGFASLDSATSAINLGVTAYITKPISIESLLLQVEKAVATRLFHCRSLEFMKDAGAVAPQVKDHLFDITSLYHFSRKLMLSLELPEIMHVVLQEINERMASPLSIVALKYLNYSEIAAMPRFGEIDAAKVKELVGRHWDSDFAVLDRALFDKGAISLSIYKGKRGTQPAFDGLTRTSLPLSLMGRAIGSLCIFREGAPDGQSASEGQFLHVFSSFISSVIEHGYVDLQAKLQARTDGLTGIANHRCFHETLAREISRSDRNKSEFSLVLIDIDDFKAVNDEHGHLAGDAVIKDLAMRIASIIRRADTFARQGGEEFSLILPDTSIQGSKTLAERVRAKIESKPFGFFSAPIPYTISLGISVYNGNSPRTKDELIRDADEALYQSKQGGKNRVSIKLKTP
jgi:two-component system, cell cycle response regulator